MGDNEHFRQTTETHTMRGDDTVSAALILMKKLPNGWKLESLVHQDGWWTAVVRERREVISS